MKNKRKCALQIKLIKITLRNLYCWIIDDVKLIFDVFDKNVLIIPFTRYNHWFILVINNN